MAAAIAARDEGASVILVEQNFDIGGRAILSGAAVYLGGGTKLQKAAGIEDSPQQVFYDWCLRTNRNRYSDELAWTYVEKSIETFDF
jgi:succinate dehydrogenase/fumarate reductase flavoprotein subunit